MVTNVAVDSQLLAEAQRVGGHRTKKATVTEALHEYIERRKRTKILDLIGTVEFDPKYDYKKQRRKESVRAAPLRGLTIRPDGRPRLTIYEPIGKFGFELTKMFRITF